MEIYDTDWRAYSYNSSIALYLNNQGIEFDQLIKYNVRDIFLQKNHAEKETGRLVPDLFLFFKKFYIGQLVSTLVLICFGRPRLRHTIKTKLIC